MYKVLSPWAEADPIPLKGLAPRLIDLTGKKIGMLCNNKRAAEPILTMAEKKLKEKYPSAGFTWFNTESFSISALEKERIPEFEAWIKEVDAVIAAVGD